MTDIKQNVTHLLELMGNGTITQYRVAKDNNIPLSTFTPYLNGKSDVENMRLGLATQLSKYYIEVVKVDE